MIYYANLLSPSMRRVWIEIHDENKVWGGRWVTLHAEGVD